MSRFRPALLLGAAVLAVACSDGEPTTATLAAPLRTAAGRVIPGEYIVVLKEGANPRSVAAAAGVSPSFVYTAALNGFAAVLSPGQLNALRHNPAVAYVEENQEASIALTQTPAPWGLDRIDQRSLPLSNSYTWSTGGSYTVYAYVLDTGLQADHPHFGGRAANVYDYEGGDGSDCPDGTGHGTQVAGIIGAETWGVARTVRLRGVRVADCGGGSSTIDLVAGVDWVRANHVKPAVANISLSLIRSDALNTAVTNLVNAGVFTAVGVGNAIPGDTARNVCGTIPGARSPASAEAAFTVAASDNTDRRAAFSHYGSCVDAYAPGVDIPTISLDGTTVTVSGTSMASPHVAGVAALYKKYGDAPSSTVANWIISNATLGVIQDNRGQTPNRLLYKSTL